MRNEIATKNLKFTMLLPRRRSLVIGLDRAVIICGGMNLGIDFTGGTMMTYRDASGL